MCKINRIALQNFRCFSLFQQQIEKNIVLIQGANGTGKSTILEAIHTAAFAKSFRASDTNHLRKFETQFFSVSLSGTDQFTDRWDCRIVENTEKKEVTFNGKKVRAFKELIARLKVITAIEEDLLVIAGSPEHRRSFIDKAVSFQNPSYVELLQTQKKVLLQKNALLKSPQPDYELFKLWSQKQDQIDEQIRKQRHTYSNLLIDTVNTLGQTLTEEVPSISAQYDYSNAPDLDTRWAREASTHRILWGSHKDDIILTFNHLPARFFASRGQQKWTLLLLKLAQAQLLSSACIMLFDDFLTDLDPIRAEKILRLALATNAQIFITIPLNQSIESYLSSFQPQVIQLANPC